MRIVLRTVLALHAYRSTILMNTSLRQSKNYSGPNAPHSTSTRVAPALPLSFFRFGSFPPITNWLPIYHRDIGFFPFRRGGRRRIENTNPNPLSVLFAHLRGTSKNGGNYSIIITSKNDANYCRWTVRHKHERVREASIFSPLLRFPFIDV